jgi:hypothetical protein
LSSSLATPAGPHEFCQRTASPRFSLTHQITCTRNVSEQGQTGSQALAKGLTPAHKDLRNGQQAGCRRHFERRLTLVDPRPQLWIRPAIEENLDGKRVTLGHGHVERRVVIDSALVRVRARPQ